MSSPPKDCVTQPFLCMCVYDRERGGATQNQSKASTKENKGRFLIPDNMQQVAKENH